METEATAAPPSRRPRTPLLVLLGIVVVLFFLMGRQSADPVPPTSNSGRPGQQAASQKLNPAELDVRLEDLEKPPPEPDKADRNPFRFQPKAPPPPPPNSQAPPKITPVVPPDTGPPPPPPPPPIALKFIGVTEAPGVGKIAALTDCRNTEQGREGETVYGRYRLVKIGVESLVIEYTDGKGRTTLRMTGQGCGS